jgi:hypothetical protein
MKRQTEAARLRVQGLTLEAIGQQLGISRQGVHQHLKTGIRSRCSKSGQGISLRYTRQRERRLALCLRGLPALGCSFRPAVESSPPGRGHDANRASQESRC